MYDHGGLSGGLVSPLYKEEVMGESDQRIG